MLYVALQLYSMIHRFEREECEVSEVWPLLLSLEWLEVLCWLLPLSLRESPFSSGAEYTELRGDLVYGVVYGVMPQAIAVLGSTLAGP